MSIPTVAELILAFDLRRQSDIALSENRIYGQNSIETLLPGLILAFPQIKSWQGRNAILFEITRYARTHHDVVGLALSAAHDSAYMVRMQACGIMAYSLDKAAIPTLQELFQHRNAKTREDAAAAIDAIEHNNHHYWIDRDHSGGYWIVNPSDQPAV